MPLSSSEWWDVTPLRTAVAPVEPPKPAQNISAWFSAAKKAQDAALDEAKRKAEEQKVTP